MHRKRKIEEEDLPGKVPQHLAMQLSRMLRRQVCEFGLPAIHNWWWRFGDLNGGDGDGDGDGDLNGEDGYGDGDGDLNGGDGDCDVNLAEYSRVFLHGFEIFVLDWSVATPLHLSKHNHN